MVAPVPSNGEGVERREDFTEGKKPRDATEYRTELRDAAKRTKSWAEDAEKVEKRYNNEKRNTRDPGVSRKVNILWSNTEVLRGALYGNSAKPDIRRRFPDRSTPTARVAAEVLERAVSFNCDEYDFDATIASGLDDSLIAGNGVVWVRYEPRLDEDDNFYDQSLETDYVNWRDFRYSSGRTWKDVYWAGRAWYMTRDQLEREFGKEHGSKVPLNARIGQDNDDKARQRRQEEDDDPLARAVVWEIWDKRDHKRVYVCEDYPLILKEDDDPYRLKRFFPCPEPLAFNRRAGSMTPIPEYLYYQDQAYEIDMATTRIAKLIGMLKYNGIYNPSADGVEGNSKSDILASLPNATDGQFLPFKGFDAALSKAGGRGSILDAVFAPRDLNAIIGVIIQLEQHRVRAIQSVYEITGISDVIRGATDPNETAAAQRLKSQFGSMRLQKRQKAVQNWIRAIFRIKAEIIAEWFEPEILADITGIQMPFEQDLAKAEQDIANLQMQLQGIQQQASMLPPPMDGQPSPEHQQIEQRAQAIQAQMEEIGAIFDGPNWPGVMEILRSDERRSYAVDIQTDSTILTDEAADREARNEFLQVFTGVAQTVMAAAEQQPEMLPLLKEITLFTMRGYKIGRTLEEAVEDLFNQLEDQMEQQDQAEPPEDPQIAVKMKEIEQRGDIEKAKLQQQQTRDQGEFDLRTKEMDQNARLKKAELVVKSILEGQKLKQGDKKLDIDTGKMVVDTLQKLGAQEEGEPVAFGDWTPEDDKADMQALVSAVADNQAQATQAISTLAELTAGIHQSTQALTGAVQDLAAQQSAPVSFVRDEAGNAVGVEKGGVVRPVIRDEQGRAAGLQ